MARTMRRRPSLAQRGPILRDDRVKKVDGSNSRPEGWAFREERPSLGSARDRSAFSYQGSGEDWRFENSDLKGGEIGYWLNG